MSPVIAAILSLSLLATDEVARVDETPIGAAAFAQRAAALRARRAAASADDVLGSLVDEIVLADDARRSGLAKDPAVAERIAAGRRRTIVNAFLEKVSAAAKPTDAELRAAYHATSDFVRAQTVAYPVESEARRAADRLRTGGAFADEAERAKKAGARVEATAPFAMRAQLDPAYADALFGARPGALVGPVKVRDEWVVAKVLEVVIGGEAEFASSRPTLYARAQARMSEAARRHLVAQLLASAPVVVDEAFLADVNARDASDADLRHAVATVGAEKIAYSEVVSVVRSLAAIGNAHASAIETKRQVVRSLAEERLLLGAATERGVASEPAVREQIALVERGVLASAALDRIQRSLAAVREADRDDAVRSRVEGLRAKARISIDRAALARVATLH